ncbi:hypothetical protein [uncultured Ruegeria sp.]|uniref:hypothetical protein n=1 Tax=uncultured Ruegeria sp. TaxID=259304 RepID=UPI00261E3114|nr:hypothetical protein [uncultured Ruegeria sp.]
MIDHQHAPTAMGCAHKTGGTGTKDDRIKGHALRMAWIGGDGKGQNAAAFLLPSPYSGAVSGAVVYD